MRRLAFFASALYTSSQLVLFMWLLYPWCGAYVAMIGSGVRFWDVYCCVGYYAVYSSYFSYEW